VDYPIVGELKQGARVTLTAEANDWYEIGHGKWVFSEYIDRADKPQEPAPAPQPSGDNWRRSIVFVRKWEGGWADDPNDPGGATNKGITLGTYTRWREAQGQPAPTKADLRAISDTEVSEIYRQWYWQASGADRLSWPLALAQFDTAVNAGVGKAQEMLQRSNGNFLAYMGHLIDWYTRIDNFEHFGRAWIRRRADLLLEASK
jgi:lysozyme family protein